MFDDIYNLTSREMGLFSDSVNDEFGQSIITGVFEPILHEINGLQQLDELFQNRVTEIQQLTDELRSIGSTF